MRTSPRSSRCRVELRSNINIIRGTSRRAEPVPSSQRAANATRMLELELITEANKRLDRVFTKQTQDRICSAILQHKPTEAKAELEDYLERLSIHAKPLLIKLVRVYSRDMLNQVYPSACKHRRRSLERQFHTLKTQFIEKLGDRVDAMRNGCLAFLIYVFGGIDSDVEVSDPEDAPLFSPAMAPRNSVGFARAEEPEAEESGSDEDEKMPAVPVRKYSVRPTIPGRLCPMLPSKKFSERIFSGVCFTCLKP